MLRPKVFAAAMVPICLAIVPATGSAQNNIPNYTGQAIGASVNALSIKTTISDTGQLQSPGSLSTKSASVNLPPILSTGLLTANSTAGSDRTSSQASVANVNLSVLGIGITASVLTSNATAQACDNVTPAVSGGSTIVDLKVNGLSVNVTGAPNQTVPLLVGTLIINEQKSSVSSDPSGASAGLIVNALHLKVSGVADVVVASAQASVLCGGMCGPPVF